MSETCGGSCTKAPIVLGLPELQNKIHTSVLAHHTHNISFFECCIEGLLLDLYLHLKPFGIWSVVQSKQNPLEPIVRLCPSMTVCSDRKLTVPLNLMVLSPRLWWLQPGNPSEYHIYNARHL